MTDRGPLPASISYVNYVLYGRPVADDSFPGQLMQLIAKADKVNLGRLYVAFPLHVAAFAHWQASSDGTGWESQVRGALAEPETAT